MAQNNDEVLRLLRRIKNGEISPEAAAGLITEGSFTDLGYAKVDHHRALRQGVGEVIYGQGKTKEQIAGILQNMGEAGARNVLVTRIGQDTADFLQKEGIELGYHAVPRLAVALPGPGKKRVGKIVIASGGTSDMAVCEEAALTAETLGNEVCRLYDVGVAGLHRLLSRLETLQSARVVVAVAGMEGALASVIGGLVSCPVIAVPTSVGYGANFGGLAALLSMLNSCSAGVSVVNIDNGFGAGFLASRINQVGGRGGEEDG
ncbi:MAG: nickel pincer cofactor biosynthesis protein LarB [Christensenellaceae bacterium]|jgi:NCAIR mutase (PurE)-related protein|nr:nickel pincer cofactor biosynthesis protein LarB [Christensenellaceae bacterium]